MATKHVGISADLGFNADQAVANAKAATKAAKEYAKAIADIKAPRNDMRFPPPPTKQIQTYNAALEIAETKRIKATKAALDAQVRHYATAHKEINRIQLSSTKIGGQFDHLKGTQFAGGTRGTQSAGRSRAGGNLAVGYNFAQDFAQGGFAGIANNIPQMIEMITQSPAMKMIGAAAITAAATAFAGYKAYDIYQNTGDRQLSRAGDRYANNKDMADSRQQKRANEKEIEAGKATGESEASRNREMIRIDEKQSAAQRLALDRTQQIKDAEADLRRIRIEAITDPAEKAAAIAAEQKRQILEKIDLEKKAAQSALETAAAQQKAADAALLKNRQELDSLPATALTPADIARRESLTGARAGLNDRAKAARDRVSNAESNLSDINFRQQNIVPNQIAGIDEQAAQEKGKIRSQEIRDNVLDFFDTVNSGMRAALDLAKQKEASDKAALAASQQKAAMDRQLDIAEAQAGGNTRKAKKLQKAADLESNTQKYLDAGFTPAEAAQRAQREAAISDRRDHPNRIRGAGYGKTNGAREGSLLDAPRTSNLDAYRAAPGLADRGLFTPDPTPRATIKGAGRPKEVTTTPTTDKSAGDTAKAQQELIAAMEKLGKIISGTARKN